MSVAIAPRRPRRAEQDEGDEVIAQRMFGRRS
jgi:hypothetical protein